MQLLGWSSGFDHVMLSLIQLHWLPVIYRVSCAASSTPSIRSQSDIAVGSSTVSQLQRITLRASVIFHLTHGLCPTMVAHEAAGVRSLTQVLPPGMHCLTTSTPRLIQPVSENCQNLIVLELLPVFIEVFELLLLFLLVSFLCGHWTCI